MKAILKNLFDVTDHGLSALEIIILNKNNLK